MPVPSDGYPSTDPEVPVASDDTADYAGLSFSAAGGTSWPARVIRRLNLLSATVLDLIDRVTAVEGATLPDWVDFTPHVYYAPSSGTAYTEITYGTGAIRDGWYRDDGNTVDFVSQIRLGTDADLGPDGRALCIGLPVEADTDLGNTYAVAINAQVTLGLKLFNHETDVSLHAGRLNDLANGNFAYFVATGGIVVVNTDFGTTSDGNASTGWHDIHVAGRFRRA